MNKFIQKQLKWSTPVELPTAEWHISHTDPMLMIGSCFAQNIGSYLQEYKFLCDVNPYGILYNPLSIAHTLEELGEEKEYMLTELRERNGIWHSWAHHGDFSSTDPEKTLQQIRTRMMFASKRLKEAHWLIITFGTARVYRRKETGEIVGNCHKYPHKEFEQELLSVECIVQTYIALIEKLRRKNPHLKILFTVSPIRHTKDGMHGNQISKATLLLAVEALCKQVAEVYYFPAYELVLDELRDYRFYAEDLVHPSSQAVEYVWNQFCACCFTEETLSVLVSIEEINKALSHKPFYPSSATYQHFLSQIWDKIQALKQKMPYLDFQNEEQICQTLLKPSFNP